MPTASGENEQTEFKSSFSDAAIETLPAFANTKGGRVYIGLEDNGKPVKGFKIGTETLPKMDKRGQTENPTQYHTGCSDNNH